MRSRPADLGARHHQAEMLRLRVLSARFQTMCHSRTEAYLIATQAVIDAAVHLLAKLMHSISLWLAPS